MSFITMVFFITIDFPVWYIHINWNHNWYMSQPTLQYGSINVKNEHIASTLIVTNRHPYLEPSRSKKSIQFLTKNTDDSAGVLCQVEESPLYFKVVAFMWVYREWTLYFINVFLHTILFLQPDGMVDWTICIWNSESALYN